MREYITSQRRALNEFFEKNSNRQLSIDEILAELPKDAGISRSSVYRNIGKLVAEGLLRKSVSEDGRKALYQHTGCDRDCGRIHLQCEQCGRMFHLERAEEETELKSALADSGFSLNEHTTVLLGTCRDCHLRKGN